jgi:hypothetical protein
MESRMSENLMSGFGRGRGKHNLSNPW